MTSASVPVDAEVKVTLNQSAVPRAWCSTCGPWMKPACWATRRSPTTRSFTIPAGSVAKGSTVTVEAQYRDATIESEPSVLGTAAIIGVAGAGTAVIVWQGYRIGMELYESISSPRRKKLRQSSPPGSSGSSCRFLNAGAPAPFHG